jgi:hypothetical protein
MSSRAQASPRLPRRNAPTIPTLISSRYPALNSQSSTAALQQPLPLSPSSSPKLPSQPTPPMSNDPPQASPKLPGRPQLPHNPSASKNQPSSPKLPNRPPPSSPTLHQGEPPSPKLPNHPPPSRPALTQRSLSERLQQARPTLLTVLTNQESSLTPADHKKLKAHLQEKTRKPVTSSASFPASDRPQMALPASAIETGSDSPVKQDHYDLPETRGVCRNDPQLAYQEP